MRSFYLAYRPGGTILSQAVIESRGQKLSQAVTELKPRRKSAQVAAKLESERPPAAVAAIPWGHNLVLLFKLDDRAARLWYAEKAITNGWSRAVLTVQIESDLFGRQGKAVTNFSATLPAPQSDLAQQTLKDPYVFDFLTLHDDAREQELESALVDHVQKFLLEMGTGFAFVGRQVPLAVGDDAFYLDLLFYHLNLRCFVVIDLKTRKFTPDDAGKMNFYLSAADDKLRHPGDQPSIGLILCKRRDRIIAEYALRDVSKPIGVSEWQTKLVQSLPNHLHGALPSVDEIEAELAQVERATNAARRKRPKPRAKK